MSGSAASRRISKRTMAIAMVAVLLASSVFLALTSYNDSNAAGGHVVDLDSGAHTITYHKVREGVDTPMTARYYGIAATEYNPLFWQGTIDEPVSGNTNWTSPGSVTDTITAAKTDMNTTYMVTYSNGSLTFNGIDITNMAGYRILSIDCSKLSSETYNGQNLVLNTNSGSFYFEFSYDPDDDCIYGVYIGTAGSPGTQYADIVNNKCTIKKKAAVSAGTGDVSKVFGGWELQDGTLIYPGDVVPKSVEHLYARWVVPDFFFYPSTTSDPSTGLTETVYVGTPYMRIESLTTDGINNTAAYHYSYDGSAYVKDSNYDMFKTIYKIGAGLSASASLEFNTGTYTSLDIGSVSNIAVGQNIKMTFKGDGIVDNLKFTCDTSAVKNADNDGTRFIANGHRLILGTGLVMESSGRKDFKHAPSVLGGAWGSSLTTNILGQKTIVTADDTGALAGDALTVKLGTFVIVHSGTYGSIALGGHSGGTVGSDSVNMSTYGVFKGGTVLDTVAGGTGSNKSNTTTIKAAASGSTPGIVMGGTFLYVTGMQMTGDVYEDLATGIDATDYYVQGDTNGLPDREFSSVIQGGSNNETIWGCTHLFLSGKSSVFDAQAGGRRAYSSTISTYMEISGRAEVRHVACGLITDGNNDAGNKDTAKSVKLVTCQQAQVASLVGGGYDTFNDPKNAAMKNGSISIEIKGGIIGYVYGGGYRGNLGTDGYVSISVSITKGLILEDVFGGGKGGIDKLKHLKGGNLGGTTGGGFSNTTGYSKIKGDVSVSVSGDAYIMGSVYGGGESSASINKIGGDSGKYFGNSVGTEVASVYDSTEDTTSKVTITGGTVLGDVYGAGKGIKLNGNDVDAEKVTLHINGRFDSSGLPAKMDYYACLYLFGSGIALDYYNGASGDKAYIIPAAIEGDKSTTIYNQNKTNYQGFAKVTGVSSVSIDGGTVHGSVYGGGSSSVVDGTDKDSTSIVTISKTGSADTSILGNVFGGGLGTLGVNSVIGNTSVTIGGGTIGGNVYGGCAYGITTGMCSVTINGGTIANNVFTGGMGAPGNTSVKGKRYLRINGGTISGSAYAGSSLGDDVPDDDGSAGTADAYIFMTAGTVSGSIYGGGFKGIAGAMSNQTVTKYVATHIYIGYISEWQKSSGNTMTIGNSVYGGGDVGEITQETIPFSDVMVTGGSNIRFNAVGNTVSFSGTLTGAGNFSTTQGATSLYVYGLSASMEAIHRVDDVRLDGCSITMDGKVSGNRGDNTKYSLYMANSFELGNGSRIDIYAPFEGVQTYKSVNSDRQPTTSSSPLNRINICHGTVFEVKNMGSYGGVIGYTILSISSTENYYGAVAYGRASSTGGFVIEHDGIYSVADTTTYSDCKVWSISGIIRTVTSLTINQGAEGEAFSGKTTIPVPLLTGDIFYTGGTFYPSNGDYQLVNKKTGLNDDEYSILIGTGEGAPNNWITFNTRTGAYVTSDSVNLQADGRGATNNALVMEISAYGCDHASNRYIGYVTVFLQQKDASGIVLNRAEIRIDLYVESENNTVENGKVTINTTDGEGYADFILPPGLTDRSVTLKRVDYWTEKYPNGTPASLGCDVKVSAAKNSGGNSGWNSPLNVIQVTPGTDYDDEIQTLTGAYIATLRFSVENYVSRAPVYLTFTLELSDGEVNQTFTVNVTVAQHLPVYITFVDIQGETRNEYNYSVDYNKTLNESDCPVITNHFVGWYTDSDGNNPFNFDTRITQPLTLYAGHSWTVTMDRMNGIVSTLLVKTTDHAVLIPEPETPTCDGLEFVRWYYYDEYDQKQTWNFASDGVQEDTWLYVEWSAGTFDVKFAYLDAYQQLVYLQDDGVDIEFTATYNTAYGNAAKFALAESVLPGGLGTFSYWSFASAAENAINESSVCLITADSVLIARFDAGSSIDLTQYLIFNNGVNYGFYTMEGNSLVFNTDTSASAEVKTESVLYKYMGVYYTFTGMNGDREGYRLVGWTAFTGADRTGSHYIVNQGSQWAPVDESYVHNGKLDMYSVWERITYTVTIVQPAGGSINSGATSIQAYYNQTVNLSYDAEDSGYTFMGWTSSGGGTILSPSSTTTGLTVSGNVSVYVQLKTLDTVTVDIVLNGGLTSDIPDGLSILMVSQDTGSVYNMAKNAPVLIDGKYHHKFIISSKLGTFDIYAWSDDTVMQYVIDTDVEVDGTENLPYYLVRITTDDLPGIVGLPEYAPYDPAGAVRNVEFTVEEGYSVGNDLKVTYEVSGTPEVESVTESSGTYSFAIPVNTTSGLLLSGTITVNSLDPSKFGVVSASIVYDAQNHSDNWTVTDYTPEKYEIVLNATEGYYVNADEISQKVITVIGKGEYKYSAPITLRFYIMKADLYLIPASHMKNDDKTGFSYYGNSLDDIACFGLMNADRGLIMGQNSYISLYAQGSVAKNSSTGTVRVLGDVPDGISGNYNVKRFTGTLVLIKAPETITKYTVPVSNGASLGTAFSSMMAFEQPSETPSVRLAVIPRRP